MRLMLRTLLSLLVLLATTFNPFAFAGLTLDGVDDYLDGSSATNLPSCSDSKTIFVVGQTGSTVDSPRTIARRDGTAGQRDHWMLYMSGTSFRILATVPSATSRRRQLTSSVTLSTNQNYRVAATTVDNTSNWRINVNGTVDTGSSDFFGTVNCTESINMRIGSDYTLSDYSNGKVFHVCIFTPALSDAKTDQLVSAYTKDICKNVGQSSLVREYYLDDLSDGTSADGATLVDQSSNGDDLTGVDGANNTGLTATAEEVLSYA